MLWNQKVQTDRNIHNNKPDIITSDNETRIYILIDAAISEDRNVIKKEAEKILKHDLSIEVGHMWNIKTNMVPVITGANGTISKLFRKCLSNVMEKHEINELQKTVKLGTAHIQGDSNMTGTDCV
jgi:hypothetical protein